MLSYLLLNNELESAKRLGSDKSFDSELISSFNLGERKRFFQIFNILSHNSKLEFYIHVYFLIYEIHPFIKKQSNISDGALKFFKEYIDSKGSQLAKTSEFLEFYALPYIQHPLEHPTFSTLFKKEWVDNLRGKLNIYIDQERKRMQGEVEGFELRENGKKSKMEKGKGKQKQKQKLKEKENHQKDTGDGQDKEQMYRHFEEYLEKYKNLEEQYRSVIAITNSNMLQSQNKWFQIVKQLVQCSRSLINLVSKHNKQLTSERKFINIRKKIDRFQKFVSQSLQDMISQSQDISVFDRPSMNQISCTIGATQKSYSNNFPDLNPLTIQQYIPTNFKKVIESLKKQPTVAIKQNNISIIQGMIFRIIKSKDSFLRRQHIIGILENDVLGLRSGQVKILLGGYQREQVLLLMSYIEADFYGRNTLFTLPLIRHLILLLKNQSDNLRILEYIASIFQQLSAKEAIKLELIEHDIIRFYLDMFRTKMDDLNQSIIEQICGTLLNLTSRPEGIQKYQEEQQLFETFGILLQSQNTIVRVITNGIVYNLLGSRKIYDNAFEVGLNEVVCYLIQTDRTGDLKQLRYIQDRLINFVPSEFSKKDLIDTQDRDEIFDEDYLVEYDDDVVNIQSYLKSHQLLVKEFGLTGKEELEQVNATRNVLETTLRRSKQRKSLEQIENFSKKVKTEQQDINSNNKIQASVPLVQSYLSPDHKPTAPKKSQSKRSRGHRQSDRVYLQNNQSLLQVANFASVVVNPVTNFSPTSKIKPRQHIVNKLNNQIKAKKESDISMEEKKRHFSFNENSKKQQASLVVSNTSRHSKAYEETIQYRQAFVARPRINRSPPK